jgi:hypothetical protein
MLDVDVHFPKHDLDHVMRAGRSIELEADLTAQAIIEAEMFTTWLNSADSTALFIGGVSALKSSRSVTPMSIVSSNLIEFYADVPEATTIHFFCGRNDSSAGSLCGPQGMIRSLICQILWHFPIQLDFISSPRYRQQLETHDFLTLCDCLEKTVQRLPPQAVIICIIDSICFFEKSGWVDNLKKAVNILLNIVDDDQSPMFRLLITSPRRTRHAANLFAPECQMLLGGDAARDGRSAPSERQRSVAARRSRHGPRQNRLLQSLRESQFQTTETETTDLNDFSESESDFEFENGQASASDAH